MLNEKNNIEKFEITKSLNGKINLSWTYRSPVRNEDAKEYIGGQTTCENAYEALAMLINPHAGFNFDELAKRSLMMHTPLDHGWEFVDDYCKIEKVSRAQVYHLVNAGKLEKMKLGKFTIVKPVR